MTRGVVNTLDSIRARLEPRDLGFSSLCSVWTGQVKRRTGYGRVRYQGGEFRVHRLLWVAEHGEIADGFEPDHMCHDPDTCPSPGPECPHRACANLDHIQILTRHENFMRSGAPAAVNARKTHCDAGHAFTPANTRMQYNRQRDSWGRICIQCRLDFSTEKSEALTASGRRQHVLTLRRLPGAGVEAAHELL